MKLKFFIVVLLGIFNATILGLIIKKQGFNVTTSIIKDFFNKKIVKSSSNTNIKENVQLNSEGKTIITEEKSSKSLQYTKVLKSSVIGDNIIEEKKDENVIQKEKQEEKEIKKTINMADLDISHVIVGPLDVNCYIIGDPKSNKALVIDPGGNPEVIIKVLKEKNFELESIYLTHAHFDHVLGIAGLKKKYNPKIYLHEADFELYKMLPLQVKFFGFASRISSTDAILPDPDVFIKEGDHVILNGEEVATVYHTPGHSPGSVCYLFEKINKMYTGDTLFRNSVGRTDLWQGSYEEIRSSVRGKLFKFDDKIDVYPGHGPSSNIGYEKTHNFSV
ncbi:hypothetical protein PIROE2DRAFT_20002 [Piromyces sp. E2]|nr:hypothetical protein PIROE2DRAFT_20002 [Piromyces sp. E2]|eukprot:OUM67547.1 hypothetical protein PIROE2DRAFT_20002 [Piromyces sp. E2]